MRVLAVDVGGRHVKALLQGEHGRRRFKSGPALTPDSMVEQTLVLVQGWEFDRVSVGVPAPVADGVVLKDPVNLAKGWKGFDFATAFGAPVKVVNDAVMQAIGSYDGGRMLYLGLGTGLGSAMIVEDVIQPMELGHLPFRRATFEEYVGRAARERVGPKRSRRSSTCTPPSSPTTSCSAEGWPTSSARCPRSSGSAGTSTPLSAASASGTNPLFVALRG